MTRPSRIITKVETAQEQRRPMWQRWPMDLVARNGRVEVAKLAEIATYVFVFWFLWKHGEKMLAEHQWMFVVLITCGLFPSIAKKIIGRFGK